MADVINIQTDKGKALKDKADAALAITEPALAAAKDLLAKAEAILSDYTPSGLDSKQLAGDQFPILSREKVGGMVAGPCQPCLGV